MDVASFKSLTKIEKLHKRVLRFMLSERFSKHRYDIKNTRDNSELAKHFHEIHNFNDDLKVTILQINIIFVVDTLLKIVYYFHS